MLSINNISYKINNRNIFSNVGFSSCVNSCLAVVGKNGTVSVEIKDRENPSSNTYSIAVGSTDASFSFNLKSENIFKLDYSNANTGYNVRISKSGASQWVSSDGVVYLIALEPDSTYEEN